MVFLTDLVFILFHGLSLHPTQEHGVKIGLIVGSGPSKLSEILQVVFYFSHHR